jgi:uncharacterized protein DUF6907
VERATYIGAVTAGAWPLANAQRLPCQVSTTTGGNVAKVGEVWADDTPVMVSVSEERKPRVTLWCGLEQADLTPEQAEQLASYLRVAAARARRPSQ